MMNTINDFHNNNMLFKDTKSLICTYESSYINQKEKPYLLITNFDTVVRQQVAIYNVYAMSHISLQQV